ncbi:hypothetical protein CEXT_107641 [Caerostris extrusa]|uniref:Uncharacterized protein n=1 Tax=Caerostris extrusa TaxID=172846 RepID=A0AAV4THT0_CAEEX|nr:hypothetical protein CEXT_107641 [Caerostris extrusa]
MKRGSLAIPYLISYSNRKLEMTVRKSTIPPPTQTVPPPPHFSNSTHKPFMQMLCIAYISPSGRCIAHPPPQRSTSTLPSL